MMITREQQIEYELMKQNLFQSFVTRWSLVHLFT